MRNITDIAVHKNEAKQLGDMRNRIDEHVCSMTLSVFVELACAVEIGVKPGWSRKNCLSSRKSASTHFLSETCSDLNRAHTYIMTTKILLYYSIRVLVMRIFRMQSYF
jgi:hypothetical protein